MTDQVSQRAGELFESGLFCAESVLLAIAESQGITSDLIPRIATGFCSGIARTCGMCGAVGGGIMAISLFTGRNSANESVLPTYDAVRRLLAEFQGRFGSTNCRDLVGCHLGTEAGQAYFKEHELRHQCRRFTEEATGLALSLIQDHLRKPVG
jgi:C_GCAxxG_C_C family probable redox protein